MKIAVVVPVALVLGLGLGTAAGRMLHPPEAPAAEHDSSGAEAKDSLKPETAPHEGEKPAEAPAADSGHAAMTPVPLDATPAPVTTTPAPSSRPAPRRCLRRMCSGWRRSSIGSPPPTRPRWWHR